MFGSREQSTREREKKKGSKIQEIGVCSQEEEISEHQTAERVEIKSGWLNEKKIGLEKNEGWSQSEADLLAKGSDELNNE